MDNSAERYQIGQESLIQTVKEGPKLMDIAEQVKRGIEKRKNIIYYDEVWKGDRSRWPERQEGECTEGQAVTETVKYIQEAIGQARILGDYDTARCATLLLENLVFIGEKELQEAISAIASRLLETAREGKAVVIFFGGSENERYIALRVLEQINNMIKEISKDEDRERLRQNICISEDPKKVAELAKEKNWNCLVAVCDDFILTEEIPLSVSDVLHELMKRGATFNQALDMVELEAVAINGSLIGEGLKIGQEGTPTERNLRVFSYYFAPDYRREWDFYPGVSITGSHHSVYYGFEAVIDGWRGKFPVWSPPPLYRITRRYKSDGHGRFIDPELQQKWELLSAIYLLR